MPAGSPGSWVTAAALLLLATTAAPLQPPSARPIPAVSYMVDIDRVEVYPVVRRRNGYVGGLGRDDFVVRDHGRVVPIESFSCGRRALDVTFVIDVSRSMQASLDTVRRAAEAFIARLEADDRVALHALNHQPVVTITSTRDHARVDSALAELTADGSTALYGQLVDIVSALDPEHGRDVVFLYTDGQDGSPLDFHRVVDAALARGVVIYAMYAPGTRLDDRARRNLFLLADRTGGEAHYIAEPARLASLHDAILEDLRTQYRLSFAPAPGPAGERRIEISTRDSGLEVRHRRSYRYTPPVSPGEAPMPARAAP